MAGLLDELSWPGLLQQTTSDAIPARLARCTRLGCAGFDPSADSLTIGNLIPMMMLAHVQRHGHRPIALMGGGTGMIGDPSGKSAERQLMTREQVDRHVALQMPTFERVLDF